MKSHQLFRDALLLHGFSVGEFCATIGHSARAKSKIAVVLCLNVRNFLIVSNPFGESLRARGAGAGGNY